MDVARVGVVGAGTMGGGIAHVFSAAGFPVVVKDIEQGQLDAARDYVTAIYQRRVQRGRMSQQEMDARLALIVFSLTNDEIADADLVIEAVPEVMSVKRAVLAQLDEVCGPETVLATNTSALSVSELGQASGRPERILGLHFFNPAHVMKLVEIIPGERTLPEVVRMVRDLAERVGKVPVVVRECPGFLVNRLLMPYLTEAVYCLQEGAVTAQEIDQAMGPDGFGWPMGPLSLMDMLGLDVCHHICAYLADQYGSRMAEPRLLDAMAARGWLGQKSGTGFYRHPGLEPNLGLRTALGARAEVMPEAAGFAPERLMARLLNEAFLCLEERIASAEDIDLACITGLGMRVRRKGERQAMGPLAYAEAVGVDAVLSWLKRYQALCGDRFAAAAILRARAKGGELGLGSGHPSADACWLEGRRAQ